MKKIFSTFIMLMVLLVVSGCTNNVSLDNIINDVNIEYQSGDNSQAVTKDLVLPSKLDKHQEAKLEWVSSNEAVITITNGVGVVKRASLDTSVKLTLTISLKDKTKSRDFMVKVLKLSDSPKVDEGEKEPETEKEVGLLSHHFDFTSLAVEASYVTAPTNFSLANKIDKNTYGFMRNNSAINEASGSGAGHKGIILGIRKNCNWQSPVLQTQEKVENLSKIEVSYTIWGEVGKQNLDYAKGIYLQVSADNVNWETLKDLKSEINSEQSWFSATASVDVKKQTSYVRIFIESAGEQSTTFQMRMIIKEVKFYQTPAAAKRLFTSGAVDLSNLVNRGTR